MVQKWKNFADFSAIFLPTLALTTATASAKQFGVKFAEIWEWFSLALCLQVPGLCNKCLHFSLLVLILLLILISVKLMQSACRSVFLIFWKSAQNSQKCCAECISYMCRIFNFWHRILASLHWNHCDTSSIFTFILDWLWLRHFSRSRKTSTWTVRKEVLYFSTSTHAIDGPETVILGCPSVCMCAPGWRHSQTGLPSASSCYYTHYDKRIWVKIHEAYVSKLLL